MFIQTQIVQNIDENLFTSHPSKPNLKASSAKRSAYIRAESFVENSFSQIAVPFSDSVIKVPNT